MSSIFTNRTTRILMRVTATASLLLLGACASNVQETRMLMVNARPSNCDVQLVSGELGTIASPIVGQYEVIGYVIVNESGIQDPMTSKYRDEVRARACTMGGEFINVAMHGVYGSAMPLSGDNSSTTFAVLRKRNAAAPAAPQKF